MIFTTLFYGAVLVVTSLTTAQKLVPDCPWENFNIMAPIKWPCPQAECMWQTVEAEMSDAKYLLSQHLSELSYYIAEWG